MEEGLLCASSPVVEPDIFLEADDSLAFDISTKNRQYEAGQHTRSRSKSLSHGVVRGKFGSTKYATLAITTVADPSMMKSHLHAAH